MGHIGNALGLRLSLNKFWRGNIDDSVALRESYSWIWAYLDKLFNQDFFRRSDFMFSHCVLQQMGSKLLINIFLQDAFLQMNEYQYLKILYSSRRIRRRRDNFRSDYQIGNKVQKLKSKNINKKDYNILLLSAVRERTLLRKLVFRKSKVDRNIIFRKKLKLLALKKEKGFISYYEKLKELKKSFSSYKMLKNKERFLTQGRLFVFLRNRFYHLLCVFLKEQLQKVLNIRIHAVNIHILSTRYMTSEIILKYMVRRLEQGYFLGFLAKSILRNYIRSNFGIRFKCSGRFTRAQRAQTYIFKRGRTPLNTLKVKFDYNFKNVRLKYGLCGIKLWIARKC